MVENKVALIRTCQEQCAHKAACESNLVFAMSLSDISAISRHRSQCEPAGLSDFLKSHRRKHEGTSSLYEKKKNVPQPTSQMNRFFTQPPRKCQPPFHSFVLVLWAAHSGCKWICFLHIFPEGWLWGGGGGCSLKNVMSSNFRRAVRQQVRMHRWECELDQSIKLHLEFLIVFRYILICFPPT